MMDDTTLDRIIDHYGKGHQINKAIEALGELIVALSKEKNAHNRQQVAPHHRADIIQEIADVKITIAQLEIIFACQSEVELMVAYKLKRTLKEMNG